MAARSPFVVILMTRPSTEKTVYIVYNWFKKILALKSQSVENIAIIINRDF